MIADKSLMRPSLKEELGEYGLDLQTPLRENMVDIPLQLEETLLMI